MRNIQKKAKKPREFDTKEEEYIHNQTKNAKKTYEKSDFALMKLAKKIKKDKNKCRIGKTQTLFFTKKINNWKSIIEGYTKTEIQEQKRTFQNILVDLLDNYAEIVNEKENQDQDQDSKIYQERSEELIAQLNKDVDTLMKGFDSFQQTNPKQQASQEKKTVRKNSKITKIKDDSKQQDNSNNNTSQESTMGASSNQNSSEEGEPTKNIGDEMNCELSAIGCNAGNSTDFIEFSDYGFEGYFDINNCYAPENQILSDLENEKQISIDLELDSDSSCQLVAYLALDGTIEYREINQKNPYQELSNSFKNVLFECNLQEHDHEFEAKINKLGLITQECEKQRKDLEESEFRNNHSQFQQNEIIKDIEYYQDNNSNTFSIFVQVNNLNNQEYYPFTQDTSLFPPTYAYISCFQDQYYIKKKTYCASCCGVIPDYENEGFSTRYLDVPCNCSRTYLARVPGD